MHAFVDESVRGDQYLLVGVMVAPSQVTLVRRELRGLLLPGQRILHFRRESPNRRREILSQIGCLPLQVVAETRSCEGGEVRARASCLEGLVMRMLELGLRRLVLESCESLDDRDQTLIARTLARAGRGNDIEYAHCRPHEEIALWLPDAIAWAIGRGGEWRSLLGRLGS